MIDIFHHIRCPECGITFTAKRIDAQFCSDCCRMRSHRRGGDVPKAQIIIRANSEKRRIRAYRLAVYSDEFRKQRREYYYRNREKICAYMREYRRNNLEAVRETQRKSQAKYYQKNREKCLALSRAWCRQHREHCNEYRKKYLSVKINQEKYNARVKLWRLRNPEKLRAKAIRYRLRRGEHLAMKNAIYASRWETKQRRSAYEKRRAWIVQRLVDMARDDGTLEILKQNMRWRDVVVEIRRRLIAMAYDDGRYQLLEKEYDDGKRSVRQTYARFGDGEKYRRELQNS